MQPVTEVQECTDHNSTFHEVADPEPIARVECYYQLHIWLTSSGDHTPDAELGAN